MNAVLSSLKCLKAKNLLMYPQSKLVDVLSCWPWVQSYAEGLHGSFLVRTIQFFNQHLRWYCFPAWILSFGGEQTGIWERERDWEVMTFLFYRLIVLHFIISILGRFDDETYQSSGSAWFHVCAAHMYSLFTSTDWKPSWYHQSALKKDFW